MQDGLIVFLNGTSSSGKTSISKELIRITNHDFMHISVDRFSEGLIQSYIEMFPEFKEIMEDNNDKTNEILSPPVVKLFYETIKYFAVIGKCVIVDSLIVGEEQMGECLESIGDLNVIFVGVQCPLEELERRELARGDRHIGLAKSQYAHIHSHGEYDLTVNTYDSSTQECAEKILAFINSNKAGSAFHKIKENMKADEAMKNTSSNNIQVTS